MFLFFLGRTKRDDSAVYGEISTAVFIPTILCFSRSIFVAHFNKNCYGLDIHIPNAFSISFISNNRTKSVFNLRLKLLANNA